MPTHNERFNIPEIQINQDAPPEICCHLEKSVVNSKRLNVDRCVVQVAEELQPSVIYIDDVDKVWMTSKGKKHVPEIVKMKNYIMQHKNGLNRTKRSALFVFCPFFLLALTCALRARHVCPRGPGPPLLFCFYNIFRICFGT
jgi:hypothetical protein